jgi:outer membrane lipoprotein-sorting protein
MALILLASLALADRAAGQTSGSAAPQDGAALTQPSPDSLSGDEIFARLVKQNERRAARLRQYSEQRIYTLASPNGKVHARITGRMEYAGPNRMTFVATSEEGSVLVRRMALNRLIQHEISAASGKQRRDASIIPDNYTFTLLGQEEVGGAPCYVVSAHPKREDGYLFEGTIWIDRREFAIVRIEGHPTQTFSFWITRSDFVRQYEELGGFWLPARDETIVKVRLYGKKILTIEHQIETVNGVKSTAGAAQRLDPAAVSGFRKAE